MKTINQLYAENNALTAQELLDAYNSQPDIVGVISINDAFNHDAQFNVDEILQNCLDDESQASDLKSVVRRFQKVINGLLSTINIGDATTQNALGVIVGANIGYTQSMRDAVELMATRPKPGVTLTQCKAVVSPATAALCVHPAGMDYAVSASNKDIFSFVSVLIDDCDSIDVSFKWREDSAEPWKVFKAPIRLQGGKAGESLSQVIARPRGINSAKHFEFSYTGQYAGQVSTVNVTVGQ